MECTKAQLRERVWWPCMDEQVEQFIRACHPGQLGGPRSKAQPVRSTTLPEGPWAESALTSHRFQAATISLFQWTTTLSGLKLSCFRRWMQLMLEGL